jgi:hypothetical protein
MLSKNLQSRVPALLALHRLLAEQQIAGLVDRRLQQQTGHRSADAHN